MRVSRSAYHHYRRGKSRVVSPRKSSIGQRVKAFFYECA
jgi:hypothetical protein